MVALSSTTAAIQHKSGSITNYRKSTVARSDRLDDGPVYYSHPYNISRSPEDRREPESGTLAVFVTIREIKHPVIKLGADDYSHLSQATEDLPW